jgi:hypothetical protein
MIRASLNVFVPTHPFRWRDGPAYRTVLCLTIGFVLCVSIFARADIVSGGVYGPDGTRLAMTTFKVLQGDRLVTTFTTDRSANFSVYLAPGRYTVRPERDDTLEGDIQGYPQPVRQDVRLRRRR